MYYSRKKTLLACLGWRLSTVALLAFFTATGSPAAEGLARVQVMRLPSNSADAKVPPYLSVDQTLIAGTGFDFIAAYPSFELYEGPQTALEPFVDKLKEAGYQSQEVHDLDFIDLVGHVVNADTGEAIPPYPVVDVPKLAAGDGSRMYLVALRGYPTDDWISSVESTGAVLLDSLPPSSYVVYASQESVDSLRAASCVRGIFDLTPSMKVDRVLSAPAGADPYRSVSVDAYEETPDKSIQAYLESVAEDKAVSVIARSGPRLTYSARLADVDVVTLGSFDAVIVAAPIGEAAASSERQGMLVAFPHFGAGSQIFLPAQVDFSGYANYLGSPTYGKNITDFANTKAALIDTGFDNGNAWRHADFICPANKPNCTQGTSFVTTRIGTTDLNQTADANTDTITHGSLTASVVAGYAPAGLRRDSGNYAYGLGLAPGMSIAVDKFFGTAYPPGMVNPLTRLQSAMTALAPFGANVVNHSWNITTECAYDSISKYIDENTRTAGILHVAAAGNTVDASPACSTVRSPGTAKNGIAVGATENFTLNWVNHSGQLYGNTCAGNYFPATQDGRNIAWFSAQRTSGSLLKPDVVAPGMRVTGPQARTTWTTTNGVFCTTGIASYSIPANSPDPAYTLTYGMSAGTSFAAPVVTGVVGILRKWFANETGIANPSPALVKAMIIGGAIDLVGGVVRKVDQDGYVNPTNPPNPAVGAVMDPHQGFGLVSFARLVDSFANHFYVDQTTVLNSSTLYWQGTKTIVDPAKKTRVTLTWTDRATSLLSGQSTTTYKIVNDMFLKVCTTNFSTCWWGNTWSGSNSQAFPSGGGSPAQDAVNNVEAIIIPAGTFTAGQQVIVEVVKYYFNGDGIDPAGTTPRQDFALFGINVH